jgi:hypothetical protein
MSVRIIPLLAAIALAGCGDGDPGVAPAPTGKAPVPYAGPTQYPEPGELPPNADQFVWAYQGEGGAEVLARGVPDGSMIDVIFRCRPEQPAVQYGFFQKGPAPKTVRFGSGGETTEYLVSSAPPEYRDSDAWVLSGELQPRDEAFVAFLESGRMTRWFGDKAQTWDARTEAERTAIKKFAEACKDKI